MLAATDTFMTTALVRARERCPRLAWQLTPHGLFVKDVHSTLRAAVARHTKPQPLARTAILVRSLAQCAAAATSHAFDRLKRKQMLRKRQHEMLRHSLYFCFNFARCSASSPLVCMPIRISEPPTNSPAMNTCGMVGQLLRQWAR